MHIRGVHIRTPIPSLIKYHIVHSVKAIIYEIRFLAIKWFVFEIGIILKGHIISYLSLW